MKVNKCLLRVAYPEFHRSYDSLLSLQNHFHTYVFFTPTSPTLTLELLFLKFIPIFCSFLFLILVICAH